MDEDFFVFEGIDAGTVPQASSVHVNETLFDVIMRSM